jgi:hypothetical protein
MVGIKRGRGYLARVRSPVRFLRRGGSGSTPAMLQRILSDDQITTRLSTARGSRERGHLRRFFPEEGEGGGWRSAARRCASGDDVHVVLLWI